MKRRFLLITILFLMIIAAGCAKSPEKIISEQLSLGQKYLADGDYEEALLAFSKVIDIDAKNIEAVKGLISVYEKTGDYDKAIDQSNYLIELSGHFVENDAENIILTGLSGNISDAFDMLEEFKSKYPDAIEETTNIEQRINNLCFTDDFIRVDELTVNGKPFWNATLNDAMAAYPCDDAEDIEIGKVEDEEIYDVMHIIQGNPSQRVGGTRFIQKNGVIIDAFYSAWVMRAIGLDQPIADMWNPHPDDPGIRSIKIGDSIKTVLSKIGISEAGVEYLSNNLNYHIKIENDDYHIEKMNISGGRKIDNPSIFFFDWKNENDVIRFELSFSNAKLCELSFYKF